MHHAFSVVATGLLLACSPPAKSARAQPSSQPIVPRAATVDERRNFVFQEDKPTRSKSLVVPLEVAHGVSEWRLDLACPTCAPIVDAMSTLVFAQAERPPVDLVVHLEGQAVTPDVRSETHCFETNWPTPPPQQCTLRAPLLWQKHETHQVFVARVQNDGPPIHATFYIHITNWLA